MKKTINWKPWVKKTARIVRVTETLAGIPALMVFALGILIPCSEVIGGRQITWLGHQGLIEAPIQFAGYCVSTPWVWLTVIAVIALYWASGFVLRTARTKS